MTKTMIDSLVTEDKDGIKTLYPCFCSFWQQTCAHCKLARALDPQGEEIECVPVEVEPVKKRASKRTGIVSHEPKSAF